MAGETKVGWASGISGLSALLGVLRPATLLSAGLGGLDAASGALAAQIAEGFP